MKKVLANFSILESLIVYVALCLFLSALAFTSMPILFYCLYLSSLFLLLCLPIGALFRLYRIYKYAKKAIKYGANAALYTTAANGARKRLETYRRLNSVLATESPVDTKAQEEKTRYLESCAGHCFKQHKFYINLMLDEGMDRETVLDRVLPAAQYVVDSNPLIQILLNQPKSRIKSSDLIKTIQKVEP